MLQAKTLFRVTRQTQRPQSRAFFLRCRYRRQSGYRTRTARADDRHEEFLSEQALIGWVFHEIFLTGWVILSRDCAENPEAALAADIDMGILSDFSMALLLDGRKRRMETTGTTLDSPVLAFHEEEPATGAPQGAVPNIRRP